MSQIAFIRRVLREVYPTIREPRHGEHDGGAVDL